MRLRCFNPRAHVGRDHRCHHQLHQGVVSIHAPTWGATIHREFAVSYNKFQSTRPRGARPLLQTLAALQACFNPRAHVGRDSSSFGDSSLECSFNPRAHVGRDTLCNLPAGITSRFNPRAHVGRDPEGDFFFLDTEFQSTRPRGARRTTPAHRTSCPRCFNPRAHVGRDSLILPTKTNSVEFQSTRPRGARPINELPLFRRFS